LYIQLFLADSLTNFQGQHISTISTSVHRWTTMRQSAYAFARINVFKLKAFLKIAESDKNQNPIKKTTPLQKTLSS